VPDCTVVSRAPKAPGERTAHVLIGPHSGPLELPMESSLPQRLQKSVSGSFHKTALLQKRVRELIRGAAPLIETREVNPIKIAFLEMERGLIELIPDEEGSVPL
jgi:DNA-directed RNA polymerase subunit K/omega